MKVLTKEEVLDRKHAFTVGELKRYIAEHNISDDAVIVSQRVEDTYFEGVDISGMRGQREDGTYGALPEGSKASLWGVYCIEGYWCNSYRQFNEKIGKPEYPGLKNSLPYTEEMIALAREQFVPVSCAATMREDKDILFLYLHT